MVNYNNSNHFKIVDLAQCIYETCSCSILPPYNAKFLCPGTTKAPGRQYEAYQGAASHPGQLAQRELLCCS